MVFEKILSNNKKNVLYHFIFNEIEKTIYSRDKSLDIYLTKNDYSINEEIEVFYQINNDYDNMLFYIELLDQKNNIVQKKDYMKIDTDL